MDKQLFIPSRICVGAQKREGTYTGKLAYVIYYDLKGVRRKEKSWESWRDKKIAPIDFDNVPMEGFVLNKGVGGQRQSYGWNARNEYIRVFDPRDFEFEISVANLLFILRECDCSRGKGLEGKFVYAWDGTELVLLPEISSDYQNSKKYTTLQSCGVKSKDIILGASYTTKKQQALVYLGRFEKHYLSVPKYSYRHDRNRTEDERAVKNTVQKQYVFWSGTDFVFMNDLKQIAILNSDTVVANYAELVDLYHKSQYGTKIVKLFTKALDRKVKKDGYRDYEDYWVVESPDGTYRECYTQHEWQKPDKVTSVQSVHVVSFKDGVVKFVNDYRQAYPVGGEPTRHGYRYHDDPKPLPWFEPTSLRLYAELESGSKFRLTNGQFIVKEKKHGQED